MDMELAVAHTPCTGWQPCKMESWLDALGGHALFELGVGGVVSGRDYYNATVRHQRSGQSFDAFAVAHPDGVAECERQAAALESKVGGLYVGMRDCCRSVMCVRDGGIAELQGMCHACNALLANQAFRHRVARRDTSAGEEPHAKTNTAHLTPEERAAKLDARATSAKHDHRQAERQRLAAAAKLADAEARGAAAASEARALLGECLRLADGASAAERSATEARVALAIEAQQHAAAERSATEARVALAIEAEARVALAIEAEQHAAEMDAAASEAAEAAASLRSLAFSHALVEETLEAERDARVRADNAAAAAREGGKREAAAMEQGWRTAVQLAAADAAAAHEHTISALHAAHAGSRAALVLEHAATLEATCAQSMCEQAQLQAELDALTSTAAADDAAAREISTRLRVCENEVAKLQVAQEGEALRMQAVRDAAVAAADKSHAARRAAERAIEDAEYAALPAVMRNLMTAHKLGRLEQHSECIDILTDLSTCLANGDCQRRLADGRWPMADGRWPMAAGRWPMADGRWPMAAGQWPMADGQWPMADGRHCPRRNRRHRPRRHRPRRRRPRRHRRLRSRHRCRRRPRLHRRRPRHRRPLTRQAFL